MAQVVNADLAIETDGGTGYQRFLVMHAGPVDGVPGGKIVGAVEHDIGRGDQRIERLAGQPLLQRHDVDFRIDRLQGLLAGFRLGHADPGLGVQDLALQVGEIDRVVIDQRDLADSGGSQVEGGG